MTARSGRSRWSGARKPRTARPEHHAGRRYEVHIRLVRVGSGRVHGADGAHAGRLRPGRRQHGEAAGPGDERPARLDLPLQLLQRQGRPLAGFRPHRHADPQGAGGGQEHAAVRRRRHDPGQPAGRLCGAREGAEARRGPPDLQGAEPVGLHSRHAGQPRVQLRARFPEDRDGGGRHSPSSRPTSSTRTATATRRTTSPISTSTKSSRPRSRTSPAKSRR